MKFNKAIILIGIFCIIFIFIVGFIDIIPRFTVTNSSIEPNIVIISSWWTPEDCVVVIVSNGIGSGTVISEDGLILTAAHMLDVGAPTSVIFADGKVYTEFENVWYDKDVDVGLFRIKSDDKFPYMKLGNSDNLIPGDKLWAIGAPFGEPEWHCYGYMAKEDESGIIFLSMPLNPGNSGCPIFNECDEIVGICVAGILPGNNMSFGHTSNLCKTVIEKYLILYE